MQDRFFFSVIVNTHNSERTISSTLKSIFEQKFKDLEIILVDDNSDDRTLNIVNKLKKATSCPFIVIHLTQNMGISYSRNLGIKASKGKYIAFIDGDDIWKSNKLEEEYYLLKKEKIEWVFSNYDVIDQNYNYLNSRIRQAGEYTYNDFINNGNPVGLLTVAISSDILKKINFRKIKHEDYDLWIRLSKLGYKGYLIGDKLAQYMVHKNSISSNKLKSTLWTYSVFRKNQIGVFKSCHLIIKYICNTVKRRK